jgi:Secretion system C-terminal sorting domain
VYQSINKKNPMKKKITKLVFVSLAWCLSAQSVVAQEEIKLIGFSSNGQTIDNLVKWNAGETTYLETNPVDYIGVLVGSSVYNSSIGEYYSRVLVQENEDYISKLFKYQTLNNSLSLTEVTSVYNGSAEVDMQTGLLYSYDTDLEYNIFLNRYNPQTGTSTNMGFFGIDDLGILYPDGSCFDSDNKVYYFITQTEDGKKLVKSTITNDGYSYTLTPLVGPAITGNIGLEYSNEQNKIHLIYPEFNAETGTSSLNVGIVNGETGEITNLTNITEVSGLQLFNRTYDQATETLVFIANDLENQQRLYLYNTTTNQLVNEPLPESLLLEIEADNYEYAQARYGALGITENVSTTLSIHPNPTKDSFTVNFNGSYSEYELFDLVGKSVQKGTVQNGQEINVGQLNKGST